jgi:probable HAF family extracellular repeat protein
MLRLQAVGWMLALVAIPTQALRAATYSISRLSPQSAISASVNNNGRAVVAMAGEGQTLGDVLYVANGISMQLPSSDGFSPLTARINNLGQAVGSLSSQEGLSRTYFFDGFTLQDLGALGGLGSAGIGLNDHGDIAGQRYFNGASEAFVLPKNRPLHVLPTLGGNSGLAAAVNNLGQVVGTSNTTTDGPHMAFLYDRGLLSVLGTLGGATSIAGSINDAGDIVGQASIPTGESHAVKFVVGGIPIDLASSWHASSAADINAHGQIVGQVRKSTSDNPQAALFALSHPPVLLRDLTPSNSGWDALLWATDISDNGQIVGVGVITGEPGLQAFLMTPVPEPPHAWRILSALLAPQLRRRRH